MPEFQSSAQSGPILGPKARYFVPGGVTQLMVPPLHPNPSTLVPATKAGDHHAPQGPQGLQTPDLLCINCPWYNISSKTLHSQRYLATQLENQCAEKVRDFSIARDHLVRFPH